MGEFVYDKLSQAGPAIDFVDDINSIKKAYGKEKLNEIAPTISKRAKTNNMALGGFVGAGMLIGGMIGHDDDPYRDHTTGGAIAGGLAGGGIGVAYGISKSKAVLNTAAASEERAAIRKLAGQIARGIKK